MRHFLCCLLCVSLLSPLRAQFAPTGRTIVDTLCTPYFWGRGYTAEGCSHAAYYLQNQFDFQDIPPLGERYFQEFPITVNTFPKALSLQLGSNTLIPGRDFQPHAESPSGAAKFKVVYADTNAAQLPRLTAKTALALPKAWISRFGTRNSVDSLSAIYPALIVEAGEKLTWTVGREQLAHPVFEVLSKWFWKAGQVKFKVAAVVEKDYYCNNVCAMVKGTQYPDSFLVLTAHYDHLGGMGAKTYIQGANDNASGTAMLLTLAYYFKQHPQKYSIVFIAFAGEEAGLVGSKYFIEHPRMELPKIKFLFNLDLMGTGAEGATVVNATVFREQFARLKRINDKGMYLPVINERGEAANSDHYWFTQRGVPSFFMYLQDKNYTAYHNINDRARDLPLTRFDATCKLIIDFFNSF
ncbi:MAG: M20/M25/M40 family metallo-hydrolase [Bacteroidota bacterium]